MTLCMIMENEPVTLGGLTENRALGRGFSLQNSIWWNTSNLTMRNSPCTWAMPSSPSLIREEGISQVLPVGKRDILQMPVLPS